MSRRLSSKDFDKLKFIERRGRILNSMPLPLRGSIRKIIFLISIPASAHFPGKTRLLDGAKRFPQRTDWFRQGADQLLQRADQLLQGADRLLTARRSVVTKRRLAGATCRSVLTTCRLVPARCRLVPWVCQFPSSARSATPTRGNRSPRVRLRFPSPSNP